MRPRVLLQGLLALPGLTVLAMYAGSGGAVPPPSDVGDPVLVRRMAAASNDELLADSIRSTSTIIKIDTVRVDSVKSWYTKRDTVRIPAPAPVPSAVTGIPFGSYECTGKDLGRFSFCIRSASKWSAGEMAGVQAAGGKFMLNQGGYDKFRKADRTFDPVKYQDWVLSLQPFVAAWQPYLASGTLMGVQVIDDIGASTWGVRITQAQIEDMAKAWKQIMPEVTTFVREKATGLTGFPWISLDASISGYNARYMGDITKWRDSNVVAAKAANLGLMLSLNLLDGGKLVPGCFRGANPAYCALTPDELLSYGAIEISTPEACAVATWKTSPAYQAQPGVSEALKTLAALAALRSGPPCGPPRESVETKPLSRVSSVQLDGNGKHR